MRSDHAQKSATQTPILETGSLLRTTEFTALTDSNNDDAARFSHQTSEVFERRLASDGYKIFIALVVVLCAVVLLVISAAVVILVAVYKQTLRKFPEKMELVERSIDSSFNTSSDSSNVGKGRESGDQLISLTI